MSESPMCDVRVPIVVQDDTLSVQSVVGEALASKEIQMSCVHIQGTEGQKGFCALFCSMARICGRNVRSTKGASKIEERANVAGVESNV